MTTDHHHPANVAFDRFKEAYPSLFCMVADDSLDAAARLDLARRLFDEGWLACKVAADNAMNGTV